jgi:hypothetical protein
MSAPVRDAFAARFGEDQAAALEAAAEMHANEPNSGNRGSDPFKWVIAICIGYQCFEVGSYREHHGITADFGEVRQWVLEHGDLASHDGDVDYLSAFCGAYEGWVKS